MSKSSDHGDRFGVTDWLKVGLAILMFFIVTGLFTQPRLELETSPGAPEQTAGSLEVVSWKCEPQGTEWMKFLGEVRNTSTVPMESVKALGLVRDSAGIVGKDFGFVDYDPLRPGETSPFDVLVKTGGRAGTCEVSFTTLAGELIPTTF